MNNPYFNLIHAIWQNAKPWRHTIVGFYIASIVAQMLLSCSPYAFGRAMDVLQKFTPDRLHEVIFWLSAGVILVFSFWLFHGPARVQERIVALKMQQAFRIRIYEQLTQLPLKWHQDHHSGNVITRVNRSATALYRFAGDQFIYIQTIIKFLVSIGFLLWISIPVGLLSLVTCVLAISIVMIFDRRLIPLYDTQNEIDNHVGAVFFDYITNMTTILTLRLAELTRSNLFQRMLSMWPFYRRDVVLNEAKWFCIGILLNAMQAIILIGYIVYSVKTMNVILIGTVVMIFRYQWDLNDVFYTLSAHYSDLVRMDTDVKGMEPVLDDIKKLAHRPEGETTVQDWHTLTISSLSYHHAEHSGREKIFEGLTFRIRRREKIALIGASGSGKSTLLNLLRGLYIADHVRLTVDNNDFNTLEPLQAITTLIPQDPEIFENTILFNITMDVVTELDEINRTIELASFSQVLEKLPSGLETDIREKGFNLSVGQKQRLALARGLFAARFSSLILMDEPTSSVDLPTEKEILARTIDAFPDAAMIVSLHRLHLLPKFDRIIMLSHGKVVADGLTPDLLRDPGPVRDLWESYQEK